MNCFEDIARDFVKPSADSKRNKLSLSALEELEQCYVEAVRRMGLRVDPAYFDLEAYPMTSITQAVEYFTKRLLEDVRAAFTRIRLEHSLTPKEKLEALRGMLLTRHLDARLKKFFISGEVKAPDGATFQGKGFRSMGQEAIYAAALRLKRGDDFIRGGKYFGDYVAPMIRDLGLALAMGQKPYDVMAAQMGKVGKPTDGKDLHIGDFSCGVLPPAAPITISTGSACGIGFALKGTGRVMINCIGEGGTSAGEWHEVINFAAVQKMPIVFIVQNNQTALSTPVHEQSAAFNFAQKAIGYGMRGITIDGTDPEEIFAAVTEAAEACRAGEGPVLVELVCMRMCGHAHHDDMLYFGKEPEQFLEYVPPKKTAGGYVDAKKYAYWYQKDPIKLYRNQLLEEGVLDDKGWQEMVAEVEKEIEAAAQEIIAAPWPKPELAGHPVFTDGEWQTHRELLAERQFIFPAPKLWQPAEPSGVQFDANGKTFWQAIVEALTEEMRRDPNTFMLGEDIGGNYGNAFVILKSMLEEFGERMINTPMAEAAIIACATGAALVGKRPIAEIQFNDFIASGFNQLVNNAAKIYYRWGQPVPMTIRLPWGGLRNAGPYHSQNTEPWFYRTPGLKIVCPSTPREAKGLLKAAIRDDNPVLYLEHIALYRLASIKQQLPEASEDFLVPIGTAHLKREGSDLTMITYGAYVHRCLAAAQALKEQNDISCQVLDLRSLMPLDKTAILDCARQTGRVLIVQEDSKTGSLGQSIASIIAEEAFEYLDAPVRVLSALDAPVPYSPPLEEFFLVSQKQIEEAARRLIKF
ncbi:MAG: dehydrogenase E1 component subunit alpha/beta [candidate division KSB1 bacterium]|nr:dehydrogenase E1 component subunit alpha/beta [candidate division KSB1 bacterium]MDZ7368860.1 dehydrogenase E1 component subunit alpha/beta [candidate division KSB1 bacterium]MDZ7407161.1 dehydrogenase E1 component subunit alpha/beta [candidate division KSB1 bacterium]